MQDPYKCVYTRNTFAALLIVLPLERQSNKDFTVSFQGLRNIRVYD
jgi:hypothetical protein